MDADRIECEGCKKPVNARFASCPFCGHQLRERAIVRPSSLDQAPSSSSGSNQTPIIGSGLPKEARIALAKAAMTARPAPEEAATSPVDAIWNALRPSPSAHGTARVVELVLTAITLPCFLTSLVSLIFGVKRWSRNGAMNWIVGATSGPSLVYPLLSGLGLGDLAIATTLFLLVTAWTLRAAIRFWAVHKRALADE